MTDETKQASGYAIVLTPECAFAKYCELDIVQEHQEYLDELRAATSFLDPKSYRGVERDALEPLPPSELEDLFRGIGDDVDSDRPARARFRDIAKQEDVPDGDWDIRLLDSLEGARSVLALLGRPQDYEVIHISRADLEKTGATLGYDVGWWATTSSILRDSAIAPAWHPPDPDDFEELAAQLRCLNQHALFDSVSDARTFKQYYKSKVWAEPEDIEGEFCVMRVDEPSS